MDKRELVVNLNATGKGRVVYNGMDLPARSIQINSSVGGITIATIELIGVSVNAELDGEVKRA